MYKRWHDYWYLVQAGLRLQGQTRESDRVSIRKNTFNLFNNLTLASTLYPKVKQRGLVPNSYIHVSVSDYILGIDLPIRFHRNRKTDPGKVLYKSLTDTSMWKLRLILDSLGPFICSVHPVALLLLGRTKSFYNSYFWFQKLNYVEEQLCFSWCCPMEAFRHIKKNVGYTNVTVICDRFGSIFANLKIIIFNKCK